MKWKPMKWVDKKGEMSTLQTADNLGSNNRSDYDDDDDDDGGGGGDGG